MIKLFLFILFEELFWLLRQIEDYLGFPFERTFSRSLSQRLFVAGTDQQAIYHLLEKSGLYRDLHRSLSLYTHTHSHTHTHTHMHTHTHTDIHSHNSLLTQM